MIIYNCEKEYESEYKSGDFKLVKNNSSMLAVSMLDMPLENSCFNFKALPRNRYIRACNFHAPDKQSMMVYDNNSSIYCYKCGFGGSIFDYLVNIHKVTYDDSLKILANVFEVNICNMELDKDSYILAKKILENYKSDLYNKLMEESFVKTINYKIEYSSNDGMFKCMEKSLLQQAKKENDQDAIIKKYKYLIYK
jgi:hypothetical protein